MSGVFEFVAVKRDKIGKSGARSLRRESRVPAILYGGDGDQIPLTLDHNEVVKHLQHEAVYSHILDVIVDGAKESAVLKAVQRHPAKPIIMHLDFMRVDAFEVIRMHVPLHFINEDSCVGAKAGGVVTHNLVDIEVSCAAGKLPEYIEVNLSGLDLGQSFHLSDLILPDGVAIVTHGAAQTAEADQAVVTILAPKKAAVDDVEQSSDTAEG